MYDGNVIDPESLMIGDVVQDRSNLKPLQIIGHDQNRAERVDDAWNSKINHEVFNIDPNSDVYACVYLPKGEKLHLPMDVHHFPEERLKRVQTEYPTTDRRMQAVLLRSMMAQILADMRGRDYDELVSAIEAELRNILPSDYADSIAELGEASAHKYSTD